MAESNENENYQKANDFYKKLLAELPDFIFQFIISHDHIYSFPLVSKSIEDILELNAEILSTKVKI